MGRPSGYSEEIGEAICSEIAEGTTLREICRREGSPQWQTVYRWMSENPAFANRIASARKLGFDAIAEDILEIAEEDEEGGYPGRRRLQVEARLKLLAKWYPAKYGDKLEIEGGLTHTHMTLDQLAARIAEAELLAGRKVIEIEGKAEGES